MPCRPTAHPVPRRDVPFCFADGYGRTRVISRGNWREDIFLDDADRHDFLNTLAEACQKTDWQVRLLPHAQPPGHLQERQHPVAHRHAPHRSCADCPADTRSMKENEPCYGSTPSPSRECFRPALSKSHMSTIHNGVRNLIPPSAVSIALLVCSGVWYVGASEYFATTAFKNDWSATPLFWMLIVMITPAICFACGMIMLDSRRHSRFSRIEWWALLAAFCPVTIGTLLAVLVVKILFSMSGVGI